jgi:hypothetical protein
VWVGVFDGVGLVTTTFPAMPVPWMVQWYDAPDDPNVCWNIAAPVLRTPESKAGGVPFSVTEWLLPSQHHVTVVPGATASVDGV